MFSTAMRMKPSATSCGVLPSPISAASAAKRSRTISASSGWSWPGPKNLGEEVGHELPHHHIGVGDGEGTAAPIAGRPRQGARRVRPHAEARPVEMQDRAAAGRHGVDQHHRRAHPHARHHALEAPLVSAVEMADIGRGAAHVEADHAAEACEPRGLHGADHAARRAGQDGVLALEQMRRSESARGLHEQEFGTFCLPLVGRPTGIAGRVGELELPLPIGERVGVRGVLASALFPLTRPLRKRSSRPLPIGER